MNDHAGWTKNGKCVLCGEEDSAKQCQGLTSDADIDISYLGDIMSSTWSNFKEMLDDIKVYLNQNPSSTIVQKDNPVKLVIGYQCSQTGKEWNIKLKDLKNSVSIDNNSLFLTALQTQQGKENLLNIINSWSKTNHD
jgi:hypothetical protein